MADGAVEKEVWQKLVKANLAHKGHAETVGEGSAVTQAVLDHQLRTYHKILSEQLAQDRKAK